MVITRTTSAQWCWRGISAQSVWTFILRRQYKSISTLYTVQRQCFIWCSKTFLRMKQKFYTSCSFWWKNHEMHDINIRKLSLLRISYKSTSSTTFSILLKIWWIVNYIMCRHTSRLYRSQIKVCTLLQSISALWKCSWHHTMRNSW